MKTIFKSSYNDTLVIDGNNIEVTTCFGDTFKGHLDNNGKVVTNKRIALGYLIRAMREYNEQNS